MSDPSAVNTVLDSCCLCGFVFVDKKRKRSITGEFAEIFANVCKGKTRDGLPCAVCGTCKYRVEKAWKNYGHGSVGATEQLLKRKHPVSPLTSSQDDEQTARRIERKKAASQYCSSSRKVFPDWSTNFERLQRLQPNKIAYAGSHVLLLRVTLEKILTSLTSQHIFEITCVTFLTKARGKFTALHCC